MPPKLPLEPFSASGATHPTPASGSRSAPSLVAMAAAIGDGRRARLSSVTLRREVAATMVSHVDRHAPSLGNRSA